MVVLDIVARESRDVTIEPHSFQMTGEKAAEDSARFEFGFFQGKKPSNVVHFYTQRNEEGC